MSNPGLPAAYCPSCSRALDIKDDEPMRALGMCAWCRDGSQSRRRQPGPETLPEIQGSRDR